MKHSVLALSALLSAATASAASIDRVVVRQQWPWSTDIKVEYALSGVTDPVDLVVTCYNGETPIEAPGLADAMRGDIYGIDEGGVGTFVIDPVKAFGTGKAAFSDFRVKLKTKASAANIHEVLYKIIRIADGDCRDLTRADFYNGNVEGGYVTNYAAICDGYSSSLDDVLVWTGVTNNSAYTTTHIVMRHIKCKGVQWTMGESSSQVKYNTAAPLCQVVLTNDFWIGVFPVTIGQWQAAGLGSSGRSNGGSSYYPVDTNACAVQVNSRIAARGGVPGAGTVHKEWPANRHSVYTSSLLGKLRAKTKYDFELPTEAQWEFAARGGAYSAMLYTGETITTEGEMQSALERIAWFDANAKTDGKIYRKTVGRLHPNPYGLYDVLGMLAEYVLNRYYAYDTENVAYEPEGGDEGNFPFRSYTYANSYTGMRAGNRISSLKSNSFTGVRVILPDTEGLVYPAWDKK